MGPAYLLESKQERRDESLLECDEINYDEHTDDVVSLLEENARLRSLVVKLSEIILRNVVDGDGSPPTFIESNEPVVRGA
jgi:hypothetical protein